MKLFGRDPSVTWSVVAAALAALMAFHVPLTEVMIASIMAVLYAGSDMITAFVVKSDKQLPLVIGFAEAVMTLILVFGVEMSVGQVSAIMGLVTVVAGAFIRTQVDAPVAKVIEGQAIRVVR